MPSQKGGRNRNQEKYNKTEKRRHFFADTRVQCSAKTTERMLCTEETQNIEDIEGARTRTFFYAVATA